jgi:hypothetical protein
MKPEYYKIQRRKSLLSKVRIFIKFYRTKKRSKEAEEDELLEALGSVFTNRSMAYNKNVVNIDSKYSSTSSDCPNIPVNWKKQ